MPNEIVSTRLTKEQKEAVGLLSIGTFLEYFDLMLYVHMAVLLNELFFPKTDPHVASLLSAVAFCSTYVFRPFGALIFGWIGDNIGRKATVIITTTIMSVSCIVIANLPTYAQIGITAAYVLTLCRIVQGMSSMGEIIGAELYLSEMTKPPLQYPLVSLIGVCGTLGMTVALGVASLVTHSSSLTNSNWRLAFWVGAGIAVVGSIARTTLRETPDFANAKQRLQNIFEKNSISTNVEDNLFVKQKVDKKTSIAYFLIECSWPVWFYIGYIHCGNILRDSFGYTAEQVIHQNFLISIIELIGAIVMTYLSSKVHPLKILKVTSWIFCCFAVICPILFNNVSDSSGLFWIQVFVVLFGPSGFPAISVFFMSFPVFKRFTYAAFTYALSRATMYVMTSFALVYLTESFGHWGLLFVMLPVLIGYIFSRGHFEKLELEAGRYS